MSIEDPFFVVKEEVLKALIKTRGIYESWEAADGRSAEESDWLLTELKNSLRSIEWDLEDLEDTIQIVEKNPTKFRIDQNELSVRKAFIESTKDEVRTMKSRMSPQNKNSREGLSSLQTSQTTSSPTHHANTGPNKYSRLPNTADSPHREYIAKLEQQQEMLLRQDETMDLMSDSMGNIRNMTESIAYELDEQAVMLDEFGAEIEHTESRLDATMKKIAKVLHMSDDRRQWMAIGALSSALLVVLFMFFIL